MHVACIQDGGFFVITRGSEEGLLNEYGKDGSGVSGRSGSVGIL